MVELITTDKGDYFMPYINVMTTMKVGDEKAEVLKNALGKAIERVPGKSERWLMVSVEDEKKIWFGGDNSEDSAFVSVSVFGSLSDDVADRLTGEICEILYGSLGILPSRIYVRYSDHDKWGFDGANF